MNTRSSSWTGRTARSLSDAFGPHTSAQIDDDGEHWHDEPMALLIAAAVAVLACWAFVSVMFIWSAQ